MTIDLSTGKRYLIVMKGFRDDLFRECAKRNIPVIFSHESNYRTVWGYTNADPEELNKWICEDKKPAPYPIGSLLFWNPILDMPPHLVVQKTNE